MVRGIRLAFPVLHGYITDSILFIRLTIRSRLALAFWVPVQVGSVHVLP